ncbi:hypothetical protein GH714_031300 [Hevea brasiliensis]|uniref:Uncharacterized protein n=1 Tax=Hevea brasiliensis TaxID=3981 RepID=A0A6A6KD74_HEVBR|nr:hypothetical protein GH714_031300 [Hevea brasiliensis]
MIPIHASSPIATIPLMSIELEWLIVIFSSESLSKIYAYVYEKLIECPSIYELMACPHFNWQHIPLLEIWREKKDIDDNPQLILESYPPEGSIKVFKDALSSNKVNYDGVDIPLPFNLEILKWANETKEILSSAKVPSQVKFYNIYGINLETPHSVW